MSVTRILVLDPDDGHRAALARGLRDAGYEVVAAADRSEVDAIRPLDLPGAALVDDDEGELTRALVERGVTTFGMSDVLPGPLNREWAILRDRVAEFFEKPVAARDVVPWLRRLRSVHDQSTPIAPVDAVPAEPEVELELESLESIELSTPNAVELPAEVWAAADAGGDDSTVEGPRVPPWLDVRLVGDAGDLSAHAFATVLAGLAYRRATGSLMLARGEDKRLVYFVDGFAVSARTNREDALAIADAALRAGIIDQAQHAGVVARAGTAHAAQAELLVSMGAMSYEDIDVLASTELRNRVMDVFEWPDGAFAFRESEVPPHMLRNAVISPMDLIWQGVQHALPLRAVRDVVESELGAPLIWISEKLTPDDMELTRSQTRVLELLDGVRSLHDLSRTGVVNEDVQRFLYLLIATGFLGWGEA